MITNKKKKRKKRIKKKKTKRKTGWTLLAVTKMKRRKEGPKASESSVHAKMAISARTPFSSFRDPPLYNLLTRVLQLVVCRFYFSAQMPLYAAN